MTITLPQNYDELTVVLSGIRDVLREKVSPAPNCSSRKGAVIRSMEFALTSDWNTPEEVLNKFESELRKRFSSWNIDRANNNSAFSSPDQPILDALDEIEQDMDTCLQGDIAAQLSDFQRLMTLVGMSMVQLVREQLIPVYMYIFVRQDIFNEYQLVQAAHVTAVAGAKWGDEFDFSRVNFIVIGVKDQNELMVTRLFETAIGGVESVDFVEPDLNGGEVTAVAFKPVAINDPFRKQLAEFGLLKFDAALRPTHPMAR